MIMEVDITVYVVGVQLFQGTSSVDGNPMISTSGITNQQLVEPVM